jgi:uncharacterized phage protein (TIGR02216 family)
MNELLPWDEAIGFGLGVLGLSPGDFWRMTPRELALAAKARNPQGGGLTRTALMHLIERYPDGANGRRRY